MKDLSRKNHSGDPFGIRGGHNKMEAFSHIIAFAKETNTVAELENPHGSIRHLNAYVNCQIERSENKYKGLLGLLSTNFHNLPPSIADYITSSNMVERPPESSKPQRSPAVPSGALCGVLTRSKKPCSRPGSDKYGGRCGHHKNVTLRVNTIETVEIQSSPRPASLPQAVPLTPMNLVPEVEKEEEEEDLGVHDVNGNMRHAELDEWEDVEEEDIDDDLGDFVEYD